jgi:predicted ATPase
MADESPAHESPARITRVRLKNYKSIVECDVELRPLTILVGPNGSGKSNFVDALRFVSEALTVGLEQAVRNRGNLDSILSRYRPDGEDSISIDIELDLESIGAARYAFELAVEQKRGFSIRQERLDLPEVKVDAVQHLYWAREHGVTIWTSDPSLGTDALGSDKLFIPHFADRSEPRSAYDFLSSMMLYNPVPDAMRNPKRQLNARRLEPDGYNIAGIFRAIQEGDKELLWRITSYLGRVLPQLETVTAEQLHGFDAVFFKLRPGDHEPSHEFAAYEMSDGTLRALAVLVALFQSRIGGEPGVSLVGIEEPETGLHPAAARIILSAMQDASYTTQVLATTHSADMLTMGDVDLDSLLAVSAEDGVTRIGPIDEVSRSAVKDHLYTVGELLQADQLRPDGVAPSYAEDTSPTPVAGGS